VTRAVPFFPQGFDLDAFGAALRQGIFTATRYTEQTLDRVVEQESTFGAFTCVDRQAAMEQARRIDAELAAGRDLGPLMGVPIAIKDLFTVDGLPTRAGSRMDISDLVPPEGPFVAALRRAGCIVLGKTTTTEFALGGYNLTHRLPLNPCDLQTPRMTSGSSHGSAVAMGAGLAGFTVGSDTGGSVRVPAALCGVVGYKSTHEYWPCEGSIPLSPALDSVGLFANSAVDVARVEATLAGREVGAIPDVSSLTFAVPRNHFLENIEPPVMACFEAALRRLEAAGARFVDVELPEAAEIDIVFAGMVPADMLAFLGEARMARQGHLLDPVVAARLAGALPRDSEEYRRCHARLATIEREVRQRLAGIDAWLSPTVPCLPGPTADFRTVESVAAWNRLTTQNSRPGNLFGHCGISLPVHHLGADLPVGFQLCASGGTDAALLRAAIAVESVLGRPAVQAA